jgi:hypothetical protein
MKTQVEEKSLEAFDKDVDLFESGKLPIHKLLKIESDNNELYVIGKGNFGSIFLPYDIIQTQMLSYLQI